MPHTPSLAQRGYEAFAAELTTYGMPQRPWHALTLLEMGAWALAVDAIIDAWDERHDPRQAP